MAAPLRPRHLVAIVDDNDRFVTGPRNRVMTSTLRPSGGLAGTSRRWTATTCLP